MRVDGGPTADERICSNLHFGRIDQPMDDEPIRTSNHDLPQEWSAHLAEGAPIAPVMTVPPAGKPALAFADMPSETFEQFCLWLLKKDSALAGCKRLGGNGTEQEGIDILAHDERRPDKLNVFECKGWKEFTPTRLTHAVDQFLKGNWWKSTKNFTIILSQETVGSKLLQRWEKEKSRLRELGIESDLWTAEDLTIKVQPYPDILSKFFPHCGIDMYANAFMKMTNFHELVSKSLFDPDKRVARWAREFIETDTNSTASSTFVIDGTYRRINQIGNSWSFKGPWLGLTAILPDPGFTDASAALTFNRPDMQGVVLTVDHEWLLTRFLFREGAPLTGQYRGFIVGATPQNDDQCLDFPHCRLFLERHGVEEIAEVADRLTAAARDSLHELETTWSATDFPFVTRGNRKVALAAISVDAWHEIGRFVEEHDVSKGGTPWHMFDSHRDFLKPFHEAAGEDFDAGHHGVIHAAQIDGLSSQREVVLLWQPDSFRPDQALSPRGWWPCDFTLQWLNETLLPEVKRRVQARHSGGRGKGFFRSRRDDSFAAHIDTLFVTRDLRQRPLLRDGHWLAGLLESAKALQSFFHALVPPEPYIRQSEMEDLYRAIAIIARGDRGYVRYAGSNLGLRRHPADHRDLIDMIHEYVSEGRVVPNSGMADHVFRAMLEMLGDSDAWLSDTDRATIKEHLTPFARLRDDAILVHRHTKWT